MAKVVITIEDAPENKVKVTAEPSFETMMKIQVSGGELTSAQGYAALALNEIRKESKRNAPTSILIPRIGRA